MDRELWTWPGDGGEGQVTQKASPRSLCCCRHQFQYEGIGIPPPKMLVTPRSSFEIGSQSQDGECEGNSGCWFTDQAFSDSSILERSCSLSFMVLERLANTCPFYFLSRSILKWPIGMKIKWNIFNIKYYIFALWRKLYRDNGLFFRFTLHSNQPRTMKLKMSTNLKFNE